MKRFLLAMLLLGIALLGFILYRTDLPEVWSRLHRVGGWGIAGVLGCYLLGSVAITASWLLTLPSELARPRWHFRLWRIWMVGHVFEMVTPLTSLGGEPAKAILLKRYYGIRYRDGTASLTLTLMTDLAAQVLFITAGFVLILREELLARPHRLAAAAALVLLTTGIALFFLLQRTRSLTQLRNWLERGWLRGRRLSARAVTLLDSLQDIEDRLLTFYASERRRFALSSAAALGEWICGVLATYLAVNGLGYPITMAEALIIEAFVALVRSTFFFVPAHLGTQEGAHLVICAAITGSPELGLALAAFRRSRDLLFLAIGLVVGGSYSLRPGPRLEAPAQIARGGAQGSRSKRPLSTA